MSIQVKVLKVPGRIADVALDDCAGTCTVGDAIREAGMDPEGFDLKLNGSATTLTAEVSNDDKVYLTKKIKGNR